MCEEWRTHSPGSDRVSGSGSGSGKAPALVLRLGNWVRGNGGCWRFWGFSLGKWEKGVERESEVCVGAAAAAAEKGERKYRRKEMKSEREHTKM